MFKKVISILLLTIMVFSLAACNQATSDNGLSEYKNEAINSIEAYAEQKKQETDVPEKLSELCDGYYLMYYYIQDWRPEGLTYRIKDGILILSFYSVEEFLFAIDGDNLVFICFNEVDEEGNMKLSPEGTARSYFFGKVLKYVGDETK